MNINYESQEYGWRCYDIMTIGIGKEIPKSKSRINMEAWDMTVRHELDVFFNTILSWRPV